MTILVLSEGQLSWLMARGSPATVASCESKLRNSIFCHIDLCGEGIFCVALAGLRLGYSSCVSLPSTELQAWVTPGWSAGKSFTLGNI